MYSSRETWLSQWLQARSQPSILLVSGSGSSLRLSVLPSRHKSADAHVPSLRPGDSVWYRHHGPGGREEQAVIKSLSYKPVYVVKLQSGETLDTLPASLRARVARHKQRSGKQRNFLLVRISRMTAHIGAHNRRDLL